MVYAVLVPLVLVCILIIQDPLLYRARQLRNRPRDGRDHSPRVGLALLLGAFVSLDLVGVGLLVVALWLAPLDNPIRFSGVVIPWLCGVGGTMALILAQALMIIFLGRVLAGRGREDFTLTGAERLAHTTATHPLSYVPDGWIKEDTE